MRDDTSLVVRKQLTSDCHTLAACELGRKSVSDQCRRLVFPSLK